MSVHEIRSTSDYPVKLLYPHPQNPRRDVGDISELTESIKAHGLFQPLTIIKDGPGLPHEDDDGYTVIIGHRRLAAAKAAGLEYVPCILVEMDEREQVATMLLENMQRSDLTVYEQAQGFQLMLDLGETEATIAEKTGFSKATVKHRVKLLELDPEEFRKAEERQPKMSDYIRLEKLTDPKLKSKALAEIGTDNFNWTFESCLRKEREKAICDGWIKFIDTLLTRVEYTSKRVLVKSVQMGRKITKQDKEDLIKLLEADTNHEYNYCYTEGQLYMYLLGGERQEPVPSYEDEQKKRAAKISRIREAQTQAEVLRRKFVKEYKPRHGNRALGLRAMLAEEIDLGDVDWNTVAKTLGLPVPEEGDWYCGNDLTENSDFIMLCVDAPDKVMLTVMAEYIEDCNLGLYSWQGEHQSNKALERWYAVLKNFGYQMSDAEKALLDGTHECFKGSEK